MEDHEIGRILCFSSFLIKTSCLKYQKLKLILLTVNTNYFLKAIKKILIEVHLAKADPNRFRDLYRGALSAKLAQSVHEDHVLDGNQQAPALLKLHWILVAIMKKFGALMKNNWKLEYRLNVVPSAHTRCHI